MSNNKVKGLLKGLRYISQMFDEEKERDIQIGYPTDVKHVAHVGLDSPPMPECKKQPENSSAPLNLKGDDKGNGSAVKGDSEDIGGGTRSKSSQERDSPDLPKQSRRPNSTGDYTDRDSPSKEKSHKPRQPRRSSKSKESSTHGSEQSSDHSMDKTLHGNHESPVPRKGRRKKPKDHSSTSSGNVASKSRLKDTETDHQPKSNSNNRKSFEEDEAQS